MAGMMEGVDQRTNMVGQNRMELLLFCLQGEQCYGINVFKVREVMPCPKLTTIPHSSKLVRGVVSIRGKTIPIIDLNLAIGQGAVENPEQEVIIVTEYNRNVQGLLVRHVQRIIDTNWSAIQSPPSGVGPDTYMTAVTQYEDELIEILDVEKVLDQIVKRSTVISDDVRDLALAQPGRFNILVVDDSSVARKQVKRTLEQIGVQCTLACDGQEGWEILNAWVARGGDLGSHVSMGISDIEMPRMDGYTLTNRIKQDPHLKKLYVILHTSLSGIFNNKMVEKVGADMFVPKYVPDELATAVLEVLHALGREAK